MASGDQDLTTVNTVIPAEWINTVMRKGRGTTNLFVTLPCGTGHKKFIDMKELRLVR